MPKVKVNDIEMYYEVHGEGPPLLMLHGFTGSSFMWSKLIDKYKNSFKLITPDLRGHGKSTNPNKTFTHKQAAFDVYALLEHLEITKFKAIGYSTGGMVLLHMATQQTNRIEKMVLVASQPYLSKKTRERQAQMTADNITPEMWERYRSIHHYGDEQIRMIRNQFHNMKDNYDDMSFTPPYLSTIKAQTLVVGGDRDVYFDVHTPVSLFDSITDSYLWIVPNAGHNFDLWDRMIATNNLLDFLTGKWEAM